MSSAALKAVETYVRAWKEPDPALRSALVAECFAPNGRMVTRSRQIVGRAALEAEMVRFLANPEIHDIEVTSAIDAVGTTFRFRSHVEWQDGTTSESFDAGEIDENGQIALLLTFAGPLADAR